MKNVNKILAFLLCLVMMFSLCGTGFAQGDDLPQGDTGLDAAEEQNDNANDSGAGAENTIVSSITVDGVMVPAVGNPASTETIVTTTQGVVIYAQWIMKDGDGDTDFANGETFAAGSQYGVRLACHAETAYIFAEKIEATVNGETAILESRTEVKCDIVYWFGPLEAPALRAPAPGLRGGPTPAGGQILIPFTISWNGNADSPSTRPESVTLTLYKYLGTFDQATAIMVETKTITAADGWTCTFDISNEPLYSGTTYTADTAYSFKVIQSAVSGYIETVHTDPAVIFNPPEVAGDGWTRVTPCCELTITTSGDEKSVVVAKKGNLCVVWSTDPFSAAEREVVINSARAGIQGIGNPSFVFYSGFGAIPEYGITVTATTISFEDTSDWSFFAIGTYNMSSAEANAGAITNTRNSYGNLLVRKTVAGNAPIAGKDFSFTVTLSDMTINGVYGDMTFINGVATFNLKGGESATATGLPNGVNYVVTEENYAADGFVTTKTGDTGIIVGGDTLTAVFTNTRNAEGSLTVSKKLEGNDTSSTKDFHFTIELSDTTINGTFSGVTFTGGVATVTLKGGESKAIEGLPNGTGYEVREEDYSADGYTTTMTGDIGTIDENISAVAEFTNTRNTYGDLVVNKTVAGNAPIAGKDFSFTVTLSDRSINGVYGDMTFVNGVATFNLKGGESATATGLPNGVNYVVTEENYAADGFVTTKTGDTGAIVGEGELTAEFTNTRNAEGSLTVSKKLEGNDTSSTKDFHFTIELSDTTINGTFSGVTFTDGVATVTLKGGESKAVEGLPNGTGYEVREEDYSADGYTTTMTGDTGTIDENISAVAEFTNIRNTYGDLVVNKTVAGNAPIAGTDFSFTVTLSDRTINGTFGGMTFMNGVSAFNLKGGESATAAGLPNGVNYVVTEADYTAEGFVTTKTGDTGTVVGGGELIAEFVNTRNVPTGNLMISKTVTGNLGEIDKDFTFTVIFDAPGSFSYSGSKSGTISSGGSIQLRHGESITIYNIPAGTAYSVTETGFAGYKVYAEGHKGTIVENRTLYARFTNYKSNVPITGDNSDIGLWLLVMTMSFAGMAALVFIKERRNKKSHIKAIQRNINS